MRVQVRVWLDSDPIQRIGRTRLKQKSGKTFILAPPFRKVARHKGDTTVFTTHFRAGSLCTRLIQFPADVLTFVQSGVSFVVIVRQ